MYWTAKLKNGTEYKEGDLVPGKFLPVLHDGIETGETVQATFGARFLDGNETALFIMHKDDGEVVYCMEMEPKSEIIYRKRTVKNIMSGEELADKLWFVGTCTQVDKDSYFLSLVNITEDGEVTECDNYDIELLEEELYGN